MYISQHTNIDRLVLVKWEKSYVCFLLIIFSGFTNPAFLSYLVDTDVMILIIWKILLVNPHSCLMTFFIKNG